MSRKVTIDDKKNKRDLLMMSIEEKKKALQPSIDALEKLKKRYKRKAAPEDKSDSESDIDEILEDENEPEESKT